MKLYRTISENDIQLWIGANNLSSLVAYYEREHFGIKLKSIDCIGELEIANDEKQPEKPTTKEPSEDQAETVATEKKKRGRPKGKGSNTGTDVQPGNPVDAEIGILPNKILKQEDQKKTIPLLLDASAVWKCWREVNVAIGNPEPVPMAADMRAARQISDLLNAENCKQMLEKFLEDRTVQGKSLRILPPLIQQYLNPVDPPEESWNESNPKPV